MKEGGNERERERESWERGWGELGDRAELKRGSWG
jgi:hypothetical protein